MSRISKLPPEQWPEELRTFAAADTATDIEQGITRMLAHAPGAAMGPLQFGAALALNRTLPERLIELMLHCALYVGMGRMAALLDMTEELPRGFQRPFGETVTPTADEPVRVR